MAMLPRDLTATPEIGDLLAIADGAKERLEARLAAAEARIERFRMNLAALARRHGWPQARIDYLTGQLRDRLVAALANRQLSSDRVIIFQCALETLPPAPLPRLTRDSQEGDSWD